MNSLPLTMRLLSCIATLTALSALSGCSRSQVNYSRDDTDGYVIDYPAVGSDVSPLVQDILNREGTPALNGYITDGPVQFRVTAAKVLLAGDLSPSPNGTGTTIVFHGRVRMTLPNGQTLEFDDVDALGGFWKNGRIRSVTLDAVIAGAHMLSWGGPPELSILDPSIVETTKSKIAAARNRSDAQLAINDICSAEYLFAHLWRHDLVHQKYDFTYWQQAHELAMQHTDQVLGGTGDLPPGTIQTPVAGPITPLPESAPTPAAPPQKQIFDRYNLFVTRGVIFSIPITDPQWLGYKPSLFTPRFDQAGWTQLATGMTRIELEQRIHDTLAAALKTAQRQVHEKNAPYEGRLAQAAYVAQQPGATAEDMDTYKKLSRQTESELGPSTRHLMALRILVTAIQDDVDAQKQ